MTDKTYMPSHKRARNDRLLTRKPTVARAWPICLVLGRLSARENVLCNIPLLARTLHGLNASPTARPRARDDRVSCIQEERHLAYKMIGNLVFYVNINERA